MFEEGKYTPYGVEDRQKAAKSISDTYRSWARIRRCYGMNERAAWLEQEAARVDRELGA